MRGTGRSRKPPGSGSRWRWQLIRPRARPGGGPGGAEPTEYKAAEELTPAGRLAEAALHEVIGYQIAQASIVTLAVFREAAGAALELRPVEYTMLVLVDANPGCTAARLARALAVSAPNVTLRLEKLQRRGLVRREASDTDRRTQHLYLTDRGRKLAEEATRRVIEAEGHAFSLLSIGERAILVELLRKLALKRSD